MRRLLKHAQDNHAVAPKPKGEGHWYATPDWWVAGFTGGLVLVTGGLWIFTWLLWASTRQAVRDEKAALKVAESNAKAARDSADALPALERAYIFLAISPVSITRMRRIPRLDDANEHAASELRTIEYGFINEGKTPAIIKRISANFIHLTNLPEKLTYPDILYTGEQVVRAGGIYPPPKMFQTLAPVIHSPANATGSGLRFQGVARTPTTLDTDAINSLKKGEGFLWFYGRVSMTMFSGESTKQLSAGAITGSPIASKDMADHSTTTEHRSARTARLLIYIVPSRDNR